MGQPATQLIEVMTAGNPGLRALDVPDNSMNTLFKMGDIAVVDVTNLSLREGYVAVDIGEGNVAYYRLTFNDIADPDNFYALRKDEDHFPPTTIGKERLKAIILGRVVGAIRRIP